MADPILQRRDQMFPRLSAAQIDRICGIGVKRVASAVGEGSICVQLVHRALQEL